jgi:hypothetical protein
MECKRVVDLRFLYFDNEMQDELVSPLRRHLDGCGHCAQR